MLTSYQVYRLYKTSINLGASPPKFYIRIETQFSHIQQLQNYTAAPATLGFIFLHFANTAMGKVAPTNATAKIKVNFSPSI